MTRVPSPGTTGHVSGRFHRRTDSSEEPSRIGWNHLVGRGVKQIVGTLRGPAAALAACAVMSACGVSQDNDQATTTSPAAAEETINPWDLPIEQRPALFDPCAEIPIEAVEQGVGSIVAEIPKFYNREPGSLISCGWGNDEAQLSLLATWKSRNDYLADNAFKVENAQARVSGRTGLRLSDQGDLFNSSCVQLFFTSRGAVWMRLDLVTGLNEFKGDSLSKACEVIDQAILPLIDFVPEGDIQ